MSQPKQRGRLATDKRRSYERDRYRRLQADLTAWVSRHKRETGCVDCGFNRWPEALHFDHIDPSTKRRDLGWRDDRTKITSHAGAGAYKRHVLTYCVVRCANCHAHRSRTERHWRTPTQIITLDADPTLF